MEILVKTLEDEIRSYLEANENDISNLTQESLNLLKNSDYFLPYKYFYENLSLEFLLKRNPVLFEQIINREYKTNAFSELYQINLANPILVGMKKSIKELPQRLRLNLNLNGITNIESILDIEFFEFYQNQFAFLKYLFDKEKDLINPKILNSKNVGYLVEYLQEMRFRDFSESLSLFNVNTSSLIDLIDIEREIMDSNCFTGFLDTEKIHLQFGLLKDKSKVLLYFGYGNYYPFTRNVAGKNSSKLRFSKFDYLNGNSADINQIRLELEKSEATRNTNLLKLIDSSQQNYLQYFKEHFSYERRAKLYAGDLDIDKQGDRIFMLPNEIRTKSSALIAYNYFKYN